MPNPKWRHSKRRKRARRTHFVTDVPQIATDPTTGERHLFHRAHWVDGNMFYRGQMVIQGTAAPAAEEAAA
jgi:large subunit ribosomal protein L32